MNHWNFKINIKELSYFYPYIAGLHKAIKTSVLQKIAKCFCICVSDCSHISAPLKCIFTRFICRHFKWLKTQNVFKINLVNIALTDYACNATANKILVFIENRNLYYNLFSLKWATSRILGLVIPWGHALRVFPNPLWRIILKPARQGVSLILSNNYKWMVMKYLNTCF